MNPTPVDMVGREIEEAGFAIPESTLPADLVADLVRTLDDVALHSSQSPQRERSASMRNLFQVVPSTRHVGEHPLIKEWILMMLGPAAFVSRAILFDKTPESNWKVTWHQDLTIAVQRRMEVDGFGPWSVKAGVVHVQPPAEVLERMLTVRIHLDPCGRENGALMVIPGSHRSGVLDTAAIAGLRATETVVTCEVPAGGVLLMKPLLLHASRQCSLPNHRRIIHLEFAAESLPGDLEWHRAT